MRVLKDMSSVAFSFTFFLGIRHMGFLNCGKIFCQENTLVIANTLFQQHKRRLYTWTSPDGQYQIILIIFFVVKYGEALYSQQKQDWELTVAQIMNSLLQHSD